MFSAAVLASTPPGSVALGQPASGGSNEGDLNPHPNPHPILTLGRGCTVTLPVILLRTESLMRACYAAGLLHAPGAGLGLKLEATVSSITAAVTVTRGCHATETVFPAACTAFLGTLFLTSSCDFTCGSRPAELTVLSVALRRRGARRAASGPAPGKRRRGSTPGCAAAAAGACGRAAAGGGGGARHADRASEDAGGEVGCLCLPTCSRSRCTWPLQVR